MMVVCILSFNHPQHTSRAVTSVLAHFAAEKVILTHNGSRPEVVDELKSRFSGIHHFTLSENKGFTGGANAGLRAAFTLNPWVLFVTNDCELLKVRGFIIKNPAVRTQRETLFSASPDEISLPSGIYAPKIFRRKRQVVDSIGGVFYPLRKRLEHIRELDRAAMESPTPLKTSFAEQKRKFNAANFMQRFRRTFRLRYFYVPGTAFLIHKDAFEKLGGFDESLHTYWEDVDLSVRAVKSGVRLGIAPEIELLHKVGKTCHKDPYYTNYLFRRNRDTVSRRHGFPLFHNVGQKLQTLRRPRA